ncbi:MAG: DUF1015 family protein [Verrucomicrobiales bacterium]
MRIKSFKGLVPGAGRVESVAAVPYDVVDRSEAGKLAANNPDSLLHVSRAEIGLPDSVDPYSEEVYATAKRNFHRLLDEGVLVREAEPCMYLYQQNMDDHSQVGLVAVAHIDDYKNQIIRKHEKTRPAKEDDRTLIASVLGAHLGPVFLTYRSQIGIDAEICAIMQSRVPDTRFVAPDGIGHAIWRVPGGGEFGKLFESIPACYVADGHHRSASAARVGDERQAANPNHSGEEDYNWFLVVLFPADQLRVFPYNRVVADLNGHDEHSFIAEVGRTFAVSATDSGTVSVPGQAKMYLAGKWHELLWKGEDGDPVDSLDVSVLQDRLLGPILGVQDPRTDSRVDFVGGIRGNSELELRVDSGRDAVAFSMHQVSVDQLMEVADAGRIMPPKSTWFEPKLRSGLFIHTF